MKGDALRSTSKATIRGSYSYLCTFKLYLHIKIPIPMQSKKYIALGLILAISVLCSCREFNSYPTPLKEAERLMDLYPDSALKILENEINTEELSEKQYADWCLFLTQARDKEYVEHETDSLIKIAVDYFEKGSDVNRQMLAYYYLGRVSQDLGNAPQAQANYIKALEVGHSSNNYPLLARINSNLGMLYTYQDMPKDAIPYLNNAYNMLQLNDTISQSYILRNLGRTYTLLEELDSAIYFYNQALQYIDDIDRSFVLSEIGRVYCEKKDYLNAYNYAQKALNSIKDTTKVHPIYLTSGAIYYYLHNPDSARFFLNKSLDSEKIETQTAAYYYLYKLAKDNKEWEEYACLQEKYDDMHNSFLKATYMETMVKMNQLYNFQLKENEISKAKMNQSITKKNNTILILTLIILIVCILYHSLYQRAIRSEKWKIQEELMSSFSNRAIKETEEQINENIQRIDELKKLLQSKSLTKYNEIYILEKKLLEYENKRINRVMEDKKELKETFNTSELYVKFHSEVKITEDDKQALRELLNKTYPQFFPSLYDMCSDITEEELWICYYLKAGISAKRISDIMFQSKQSITNKRRKIATKIFGEESSPKLLDEIISSL